MTTINGVPAHPLLVHAVVVLIPLAALLVLLVAFWPAARRRLNVFAAALAAVALISVPLATQAGEWLERHVQPSPLVAAHTELGDTMLPWAIALFAVAALLAARELVAERTRLTDRYPDQPGAARAPVAVRPRERLGGRPVTVVLAVLALVVAIGSVVTVYRIGDSGSRAAWTGHFSQQATHPQRHRAPTG